MIERLGGAASPITIDSYTDHDGWGPVRINVYKMNAGRYSIAAPVPRCATSVGGDCKLYLLTAP